METEGILENMPAVDCLPENYILDGEKKKQVYRVLEELNPIYKNLLVLKYEVGLSYREIAEVLDINEQTVKTYIYRAKQKFKDAWRELNHER
ncbi:sigma-70 family RNA polymerase sigma factor [Thermosediminibacter oceani]|uniref:RNA polymerase sigma factor n=1 Tax=Thermosediminibacter oceani TaxID=291990 RepID=UPI0002EBCBF3